MSWLSRLLGADSPPASVPVEGGTMMAAMPHPTPGPAAAEGGTMLAALPVGQPRAFVGLDDPGLADYLRGGRATQSGVVIGIEQAMRNTAVFRSVSLLSFSIGMLPLHLYEAGDARRKAADHPLFRVLYRRPNAWQTAFDFRSLMQSWVLLHGDAFALKIRTGNRLIGLAPMDPARVTVTQRPDLSLAYEFRPLTGDKRVLRAEDVFHVRGFSTDGLRGRSLVRQAGEAIALAQQAETAAARIFRQGLMAGGALKTDKRLSPEAFDRLQASMADREGAENAGRFMILEEGLTAERLPLNAEESQHIEQRRHQIEEIARVFGVPRPLLMVDDTSWGSGIDVLGQLFVRYGLNPWFTAWEQAIQRCLLEENEQERFYAKFNAGALLRGSMKDQAEFFAKALGSGGHRPWMTQGEVRDFMELGERDDLPLAVGEQRQGETQ